MKPLENGWELPARLLQAKNQFKHVKDEQQETFLTYLDWIGWQVRLTKEG